MAQPLRTRNYDAVEAVRAGTGAAWGRGKETDGKGPDWLARSRLVARTIACRLRVVVARWCVRIEAAGVVGMLDRSADRHPCGSSQSPSCWLPPQPHGHTPNCSQEAPEATRITCASCAKQPRAHGPASQPRRRAASGSGKPGGGGCVSTASMAKQGALAGAARGESEDPWTGAAAAPAL